MSFYVLIPVILFTFCIALLIMVIFSGLRRPARRPFSIFLFFMALWGFFIFLMRESATLEQAYTWEIFVFISIISASQFFYRFTLSFTGTREPKPLFYIIIVLFIGAIALVPTGLIVKGMQEFWYGKAPIVGPLFPIYLLASYMPIVLGLRTVIVHYRHTRILNDKVRDSYIIVGIIFMLVGATTDFLPPLGIKMYPLGIIGNLIFCIIATIAVLRYGLLEIQVVLRKGTAYSIVSLLMLGIVISAYLIVTNAFQELNTTSFVVIMVFSLLFIAAIFQPIQSRVQHYVDKWFFRGRYDYLHNLELFSTETKNVTDLKRLSESLLSLIGLAMNSKSVFLLLPSSKSGDYENYAHFGEEPDGDPAIILLAESELTQMMKYQDGAIDIGTLEFNPALQSSQSKDSEILNHYNIALLVPLRSKEVLTGILLLAHKTSGDSYSTEDRQLLSTISNQAAVSIENARLYDQLQQQLIQSSKLASLGELATNVAHEVNNSLQSVINYGTLLYEDLGEDNPMREDAKIIETEALRARNIVEILLGIARKERTSKEVIDLNDEAKTVVTLARLRAKTQNTEIIENYSTKPPLVNASRQQLRQVLLNLLSNANDAMPDGGTITITTRIDNNRVIISLADTGIGIEKEALKQIFESLYTTKVNGTGLGLTVSKSIVEEHGGTIEVESWINKGTTFTISLPKVE